MSRRRWVAVMGLVLVAGYVASVLPLTPRGAARVNSPCGVLAPHRRFLTTTRDSSHGRVVFMSAQCLGSPAQHLGHWFIRHEPPIWRSKGGGQGAVTLTPPPASDLIEYAGGGRAGGGRWIDFVYGRILAPEVAAVEVRFANGPTVREAPSDGLFVVAGEQTDGPCELRALGADGRELRRIDLGPPHPRARTQLRDSTWGGRAAPRATCAPGP